MERYNPDVQAYCADHLIRCFTSDSPTLREIQQVYSNVIMQTWLDIQLCNLIRFCGVKGKEEVDAIVDDLIQVICIHYGHLKVTEIMLFLQQFKAGKYGRFYGRVDPLVITGSFNDFMAYRADMIHKIERLRQESTRKKWEEERRESEKRGEIMTAEEWREISWLYNM